MFGAKGSVKNRIYQFWLIRMWRERRKKRKEEQLLRRRRLMELQKKVIEEVIGVRDTRTWKLSKPPIALQKKEGVVVTIFPIGKKPDKVIKVVEEKPKVGIGEDFELEKKLAKIETETTIVVAKVKQDMRPSAPEDLEKKKKKLEQDLHQIEKLQIEYQTVTKKNPKLLNITLIKNTKNKVTVKDSVRTLEKAEIICKQELERVEKALKSSVTLDITGKKDNKQDWSENQNNHSNETTKSTNIKSNSKNRTSFDTIKTGAVVATVAGGTLIAFPALLQRSFQNKKEKKKPIEKGDSNKKAAIKNNSVKTRELENEQLFTTKENKKASEENNPKLKLYRSKLESSKEAEIIIKAELERQKNYLKRLNEKIGKVDVSKRVEYRFKGIHRLLEHVLTFALGVFTIPFSRHRIFGTALGLTLIGNSIRGIRNSLKPTKEEQVYIEWKDFTKVIYSEQIALKQLDNMVVDSLSQIKGLKEDIEREFYGKISFQEYDEMKTKLEAMELKLIEKQKQIEEMEEQLEKAEEKNKVKVKQMKEMSNH